MPSASSEGITVGIVRSTAPGPRLCTNTLTRKRPMPCSLAGEVDLVLRLEVLLLLIRS